MSHIENITAKVNILRGNRDWSWSLSYGPSSDGKWLYNFRISAWSDDRGAQPVVWWGTARDAEVAVNDALERYDASRKAMG